MLRKIESSFWWFVFFDCKYFCFDIQNSNLLNLLNLLIWISSRRVGATYKTCKNMPLTFFFLVWGPSTDIKPNWYLNSHTNCNFQVHFNIEVERNRSSVSKDDYFCELYSFFCFAGKVTRKIVPPGLRYEEITFADNQCIFDFRTTSPI